MQDTTLAVGFRKSLDFLDERWCQHKDGVSLMEGRPERTGRLRRVLAMACFEAMVEACRTRCTVVAILRQQ